MKTVFRNTRQLAPGRKKQSDSRKRRDRGNLIPNSKGKYEPIEIAGRNMRVHTLQGKVCEYQRKWALSLTEKKRELVNGGEAVAERARTSVRKGKVPH